MGEARRADGSRSPDEPVVSLEAVGGLAVSGDLATSEDVDDSVLPEDLELMPPGVGLAGLLASVDRSGLDADELLRVARARQRLVAHQEAQLVADLYAVARAVPDGGPQPGRRDVAGKYPWAECEVGFALRWSFPRAAGQLMFCDEVVDRLPVVFAALDAGEIDVPRARVIADAVGCLDEPVARAVVEAVIGQAGRQTVGQLRARLRRLVLAADPQVARKQARRDVNDRRVQGFLNHNNLAGLGGYELAPHRVAAVMERLDAIARAAKSAGDPRRVDHLRADAFLDLLVGDGVAVGGPISDGGLGPGGPGPGDLGRQGGQEAVCGQAGPPDAGTPWPTAPADPGLLSDPGPAVDPHPDPAPDREPAPTPHPQAGPDPGAQLWAGFTAEAAEPPPEPADHDDTDTRVAHHDLVLAGFDQLPTSRPTSPAAPTSSSPTSGGDGIRTTPDPTGSSSDGGVASGKGNGNGSGGGAGGGGGGALPGPRRGVVDLQVPLTTLLGLTELPGELAGWGPVIADIARQVTAQQHGGTWRFSVYNELGELAHHGITRRRPTAGDTAFVKARDRTCRAPGCRRAARSCDLDHTLDWQHSKDSRRCNLACLCKLHHRFKHESGAELTQLTPGVLGWLTPAGMRYVTHPDAYPTELEPPELGNPHPAQPELALRAVDSS